MQWRKPAILTVAVFFSLQLVHAVTFQVVDPAEFSKIIDTNAVVTTNTTINSPLEGPVWVPSDGGTCHNMFERHPPGMESTLLRLHRAIGLGADVRLFLLVVAR